MAKSKLKAFKHAEFINSYYSDLDVNDQIYASIIRSPISSGTIRSISHPNLDDNYVILTAKDIPGENILKVLDTSFPIFAFEKVSYTGEPIGLVCGPSPLIIRNIIKELDIKYTEANIDIKTDTNEESPSITENQIIKHSVIRRGDSNTAYVKSKIKIEKSYSSKHQLNTYNELLGTLAIPDKKTLTLFLPSSWTNHVRNAVSIATGICEEQISIKKTITSNSYDSNLWAISLLASQAAIAAEKLHKPVKLVLSRKEMNEFVNDSVHFTTRFQAGIEPDGKIKALTIRVMIDMGAFAPFADDIINRVIVSSLGPYKPLNFQIEVFLLRTTKPPLSIDINSADTHSLFTIELLIQEISRRMRIIPYETRLINSKEWEEQDKEELHYPSFEEHKLIKIFETTIQKSDYLRRYTSFSLTSEIKNSFIHHAPIRGIGLSSGFQGSGFLSSKLIQPTIPLEVTMQIDGSVIIHTQTQSKSIQHIWKSQASKILSIPLESVHLDTKIPIACDDEIPETMSNKITTITSLIKKCCSAIQKMRFRQPLPIKVKRTIQMHKSNNWNFDLLSGKPYHSIAWACAVIEIEVNTFTYELKVLSVWVTIDAGEILQPSEAEISVKKSIQLILANCMNKEILIADNISVSFIESTEDSKEIGYCMNSVIPSALLSALSVALNKPVTVFPLETDTIFSVISAKDTQ